jgi:hypothetical protein
LIGGGWVLFCHFIIYNELHNLHASFMMSFWINGHCHCYWNGRS